MKTANHCCQTCAYLMQSNLSETQFKCGFEPLGRAVQPLQMGHYRSVQLSDRCTQWQASGSSALSEKFL